jgi:hypothetical protein
MSAANWRRSERGWARHEWRRRARLVAQRLALASGQDGEAAAAVQQLADHGQLAVSERLEAEEGVENLWREHAR